MKEARDFLSGKSRAIRDMLAWEMSVASEAMEFERAARLRDRIAALSAIQGAQGINPKSVEEADVFAVVEQGGQFCIEVFFFRTFQNWGNRAYYPKADRSLTPGEVLDAFLAQFYDDRPPPRLVLLSHEVESRALLEQALCERYGERVEIAVPQRGEKRELVEGGRPQRPRDARPQAGGNGLAGKAPRRPRRGLRHRSPPPPHRGLRQLAHHGHERRRRHGRRRAERFHEDALPHLQHQGAAS